MPHLDFSSFSRASIGALTSVATPHNNAPSAKRQTWREQRTPGASCGGLKQARSLSVAAATCRPANKDRAKGFSIIYRMR